MYSYRCTITAVIDGDTVEIDLDLGFHVHLTHQRVRLAGIDTPESRTTDVVERAAGLLSKRRLSEQLPIGSVHTIRTQHSASDDKFGRILGVFLRADGSLLNDWMCTQGYAVPYAGEHKKLVKAAHAKNRQILIERGELTVPQITMSLL